MNQLLRRSTLALAACGACAAPQRGMAQAVPITAVAPVAAAVAAAVPWVAGEHLEYRLRYVGITIGSARMDVLGTDSIRGREAWRLRLNITGGVGLLGIRIDDSYDSWLDTETLNSLRFLQNLDEPGGVRKRDYAIYPERAAFLQEGKAERKSVPNPLDDAAFFYFLRTIDLEVGKEYPFNRYFDPDANPVIIRVLRKERINVPAGRFETIVIQPIIKTSGLFSEKGEAQLWLSDDKRRILVQLNTKLAAFSLNLQLKSIIGAP